MITMIIITRIPLYILKKVRVACLYIASHVSYAYFLYAAFATPFWRNVLILSIAGVAAVQFLPEAREDVYLTRWIAMYSRPYDYLLNAKYTAVVDQASHDTLVLHDAKKPRRHTFRYPQ
jgi:hypothetical protein